MQINLAAYANKKICVAVSGGKDSMALLHCLCARRGEFNITVCAVNCDHGLRAESASECAFVKKICNDWAVDILQFSEDCRNLAKMRKTGVETAAREWRKLCYFNACAHFCADAVATAHHANDNAETVLFNLARGTSPAGLVGIRDGRLTVAIKGGCAVYADEGDSHASVSVIRPLINCTRGEIDDYIRENKIPFVTDESNFSDDYTRNFIRHNVLPQFEKIAPQSLRSVGRFCALAAEDEEFFAEYIRREGLIVHGDPVGIKFCKDRAVFKRAAICALKLTDSQVKDYTGEHAERLYGLQFCENGKRFEFLGFTAVKEGEKIVVFKTQNAVNGAYSAPYALFVAQNEREFCGAGLRICELSEAADGEKILKFDMDAIPENAEIRFMRAGDKFKKFGGGTKSLGDFFTDKKIPARLRGRIPLVANGSEILIVCGVEISERVKITAESGRIGAVVTADYTKNNLTREF